MVDIQMTMTCQYCPVQYEGTVDGNPAYFRARWSSWSFSITKPGTSPVIPKDEDCLYHRSDDYGEDGFSAGSMDPAEADTIMRRCVEEWEKGSRGDLERPEDAQKKYEDRNRRNLEYFKNRGLLTSQDVENLLKPPSGEVG